MFPMTYSNIQSLCEVHSTFSLATVVLQGHFLAGASLTSLGRYYDSLRAFSYVLTIPNFPAAMVKETRTHYITSMRLLTSMFQKQGLFVDEFYWGCWTLINKYQQARRS